MEQRWAEIQSIWKRTNSLWLLAGIALGSIVGFLAGVSIQTPIEGWFLDGFWPELLGIGITVLVLNRLAERRASRQYKEQLVRNAGSRANVTAVSAVDEMRKQGWLATGDEEPLLKGANLDNAVLDGALLHGADLEGSHMVSTQLRGAILSSVNLQGAVLLGAVLTQADLTEAILNGSFVNQCDLTAARLINAQLKGIDLSQTNLNRADLWDANLQGANLENANLMYAKMRGANLKSANLFNANLEGIELGSSYVTDRTWFNPATILPDGSPWTPDTDISKFTDPDHPEFWEPEWVKKQREQR